jgi:hypothetical protein
MLYQKYKHYQGWIKYCSTCPDIDEIFMRGVTEVAICFTPCFVIETLISEIDESEIYQGEGDKVPILEAGYVILRSTGRT